MKTKKILFWQSNNEQTKKPAWLNSLILFVLLIICYIIISDLRHIDNPQDKIFPSLQQIVQGIKNSLTPNGGGFH